MENKNNNELSTFYVWFFSKFSVGLRDLPWNIQQIEGTRGFRVTGFPKEKELNGDYYPDPGTNGEYKRFDTPMPDKKDFKGGNNSRGNNSRDNGRG